MVVGSLEREKIVDLSSYRGALLCLPRYEIFPPNVGILKINYFCIYLLIKSLTNTLIFTTN